MGPLRRCEPLPQRFCSEWSFSTLFSSATYCDRRAPCLLAPVTDAINPAQLQMIENLDVAVSVTEKI